VDYSPLKPSPLLPGRRCAERRWGPACQWTGSARDPQSNARERTWRTPGSPPEPAHSVTIHTYIWECSQAFWCLSHIVLNLQYHLCDYTDDRVFWVTFWKRPHVWTYFSVIETRSEKSNKSVTLKSRSQNFFLRAEAVVKTTTECNQRAWWNIYLTLSLSASTRSLTLM